ncbi:unnamed protein product [Phytophthora lilii]|uniref:Unnamed protein product n=1 Tax=Phytophthora lilii TaxID=2077276 RepID=A0A9W6XDQ1_9STRA|nr:unnamed protein product [Phytophthora lilii]
MLTLSVWLCKECGRNCLKANNAASDLRDAILEAQQTIQKTAAIVPSSGMDASPLSAKDAPLLCSNIGLICQTFVRMTLAKEQVDIINPVRDNRTIFMDVIDAMVTILRYDISTALNPVPVPTESPRTGGGAAAAAAAAANAAAVNAAALAALLPFCIDRCVTIISSLGRMIEYSEWCKAHAKMKGVLPVLLDCFKVKNANNLYQVADKLLHLCAYISDITEFQGDNSFQQVDNGFVGEVEPNAQQQLEPVLAIGTTRIDPQILCSVATGDVEPSMTDNNDSSDAASPRATGEKPPLLSVDTLLSLLDSTTSKVLLFRLIRWIAALVDLPGNASALGERAVTLFLQFLTATPSDDKLLFAFLSKCIHAIVAQNSGALEICGSGGHEPATLFFNFLEQPTELVKAFSTDKIDATFQTRPTEEDLFKADQPDEIRDEVEPIDNLWKLEWMDEYDEQAAFVPKPLTEVLHNVDVFLSVAEALTGLTDAFLKWNPSASGAITADFSELIAARIDSDHNAPAKAGAPAAAGSKKKIPADQSKPSAMGEAVMLCILERGMQVPKLVSRYAAVSPDVCVSLLGLLNNLVTVPSGLKVLLHLAKVELQTEAETDPIESTTTTSVLEWPLSVEVSSRMEHALLLLPVLNILQSPDTSFIEIEAAIRTLAVMTSDLEPLGKEVTSPFPEPVVENARSPTKGGAAAAPPPPTAPTVPELVVSESDRFANAALSCGALVVLLSFLDHARIPRGPDDFPKRVGDMKVQIEKMVQDFITLAQKKQENILAMYREKLELEQSSITDPALRSEIVVDVELPYQTSWAKLLLDHKFCVPRFGYLSYSALLLSSELAIPNLVSTLLSAGASPETASLEGVTPLMIAFLVGNEEMVIDLLDAGADIDAITNDGQDLTVWNCALVSPLKARVSNMITKAYSASESSSVGPPMKSRRELDSIEGSLQFLDMCLDAGVDANVSNAQGDFLLHALLSKSIVRRKLRGLDLCFRYNSYYEDRRRLQRAVLDLIEAHSANVNSCNCLGQTPLHLALLYGYTGIAKILLSRGANPNVQGIYGHLPLHYACLGFCGSLDGSDGEAIEVTRLLLEESARHSCTRGVHVDRRKHKSAAEKQALAIENILETGLQSVIEPQSIVLKLSNAQQILATTSFLGKFLPWHFACGAYVQLSSVLCLDDDMYKWFEANGQARAGILQYLVDELKVDISACASEGVTALHLATKSDVNGNNLPVIDLLLERCGAQTAAPASLNVNAVHEHILIDNLPVIPSGAQVAFEDADRDVKQAFVSSRSIDSKYHIILADGKHVDDIPRDQLQVIYDPDKKGSHHSHHYKYLLPIESRFSALHYALQSNRDTLALRLLALPNILLDPEGSDLPLLALACAARQTPEVVRRLITQQANMRVHLPLRTSKCDLTAVDIDTSSSIAKRKHAAALHYAVMYDDFAMVEVLLSSPVGHVHPSVRRSGDGFTPLHLACEMENMKIIKLLLDHGASLTQLSSMSAHGVSPLQLLMKFDSLENDRLRELINENYLRPEMLLEGSIADITPRPNTPVIDSNQTSPQEAINKDDTPRSSEGQLNDGDDSDAPSCALLREEEHNLNLFERVQELTRNRRGSHETLTRRLETELEKSDAVLCLFFELLQQPQPTNPAQIRNDGEPEPNGSLQPATPLLKAYEQLRHRHECFRQYMTRSQWKARGSTKMLRAVNRIEAPDKLEEGSQVPQLNLSALNGNASSKVKLQVRRLSLEAQSTYVLPPVHANTAREQSDENVKADAGGSRTARVYYAPPPRAKQKPSSYHSRSNRTCFVGPPATFCCLPRDLHQKQLTTARCFKMLKTWQRLAETGVLKNLLADVHEVLHAAIYRKPEEPENSAAKDSVNGSRMQSEEMEMTALEYFLLVADAQERVRLQQQERKRLATQLAMENLLEQDLSTQLQQLEHELAQLHMRHAYNRAEIEGERRAVQILERDYATLTEQEQELQRDCEVLELQLDTQRAQLKEIRSQQLYLDFVSSAPLKRHMEEKKWQEQHAAVALQVQNADAENRALEDEIRKLQEEATNLEAQYARDVQTKQHSEATLSEIRENYDKFQDAFERTRICYTPRPDWDRIVDETPELSVQKYQWEMVESASTRNVNTSANDAGKDEDKGGILERLDSINNLVVANSKEQTNSRGRTKTLVKEMLHWIERLQKHCGVNLHLSRLNILHHQLDRAVRKTSMIPIVLPNASGVITIAAASPTSGSPSKRRQDYIMALGMHEAVPMFLRHRGKLKRRVLKKVDVEKVVRKVWVEKRKREQRNPLSQFPLEQVLHEKLHRKYGFQPLIAEWGYNLLLALQMFCWDSEIEMFLLCLTGAVSDLVYVDQEQMIQGCQQLLLRLCELYNVESFVTERRVLLKDALVALRTFFPLKTSAQLQAIEQAIIRDMHKMKRGGNDSILYIEDILPLDTKYPLGFFVKTIRTQHFKEIQDYYALLLR